MKKIMALLLIAVVAGITLPAMATDGTSAGSSSNGGTNAVDMDNSNTASNYAAHSVSVTLVAAPQTNNVGKNIAASGSVANGAIATFDGKAKADDANTGSAVSGDSGSGATSGSAGASGNEVNVDDGTHGDVNANPEAETGDANSKSKTGDANTGDATNAAAVAGNSNSADANGNLLASGSVDNHIIQFNVQKQITPVYISNDQKVKQSIKVDDISQDASSNPVTKAISKPITTTTNTDSFDTTTTDIDTGDISVDL